QNEDDRIELRIVRAAHKYSTLREFEIIKPANKSSPQIYIIERELLKDIGKYYDLEAVARLFAKDDLYEAMCLVEQLRFQIRWSQTPRIPKTSVLGHSMMVACLMIFLSRELKACPKRIINNFYA